jgi:hypothetical protein
LKQTLGKNDTKEQLKPLFYQWSNGFKFEKDVTTRENLYPYPNIILGLEKVVEMLVEELKKEKYDCIIGFS